jgi:acetoin utilization protein AcuC
MNKVIFVYTDEFKNLDFGEGHPMRGDRYKKALKEFVKIGLIEKMKIIKPRNYPEKFIELFHSPNYVDLVKKVSKEGFGSFGDEVPNFKGIFEIAFLSVKASLTAAESLVTELQADVAINICGGWHHAFEDKGRGFCIFNDIAIVVEYFIKKKENKKSNGN